MGEWRGGPPATWAVGLASVGSFNKECTRWIRRLINTASVIDRDLLNHSKLYTCQRDSGCSLLASYSHSVWRVWDDSSLSVGSDKTRVHETGVLCNLTPSQLPVCRSTSKGPPPNHSRVAWYLLSCNIHALSASSTPSAVLISSTRRVSSLEILVLRNKILEN